LGADEAGGAGGAGSWAVYPVFSTTAISSSALTPGGTWMLAFSVAELTEALTPSSRFSFFSTRAAQLTQVIPPTSRSISSRAGTCWESMVIEHSDRLPQRPHHIPLGGMKGRGVAEPPRDRRPRPRPHPPYPIPHTPQASSSAKMLFSACQATTSPNPTPRPARGPGPPPGHGPAPRHNPPAATAPPRR